MNKIPIICKDCDNKSTDSNRDAWWWICCHEYFEDDKEPIIDIEKAPISECPLRKENKCIQALF